MKKQILIILTAFIVVFAVNSCKSYESRKARATIQKDLSVGECEDTIEANASKLVEAENMDKPKENSVIPVESEHNERIKSEDSNVFIESELELLARVIWAEAGSDWITDEHQRAIASVVINRVNDSRFPNSIKDVIYQKGQYGCVYNGMINQSPNQRAYDNARYVLENGVTIPTNVVWQAQFKQGNGLYKYIQGHYFCY